MSKIPAMQKLFQLMKDDGISIWDLAQANGQSHSAVYSCFRSDNPRYSTLKWLSEATGYELVIEFRKKKTAK